ncbi:MSHA biogenesis protein MshK [Shewanella marisflavi]|uniref:MSHA biogenesis protein MshK n=1 Tax=Shewanella marisflavi TaxID=260364 RepID=UPI0018E04E1D|nr:MSHA biogenesis protein MshK [Shewanella marisflavi]
MLRIKSNVWLAVLLCLSVTQVSAQTLRDPTRPGAGVTSAGLGQGGQPLVLNSLMITNQSATAIINNKTFTTGDRVAGVRITRITQQGVWLADGRQLKLYPEVTATKGQ